ncbi:MAG TPA: DUF503 domain-containing protein [Halanaerobiales bacterium]|nr:DUF503 domain-containing protein [Halanaerobiales bacterium]
MVMIIGLLKLELYFPMAFSLKDKRSIIKSIMEKGRQRFNISISEIDNNELWKNATLGVVTVSNNKGYAEKLLTGTLNFIENYNGLEIIDSKFEYF